jgi:hypothetical protein
VVNASEVRAPRAQLLRDWRATLAVVLVLYAFWYGRGVVDPHYINPDVAGIAYNARLFLSGGLPYLDSKEIKPPGAFLMFAPLLSLGGLAAVWFMGVLWGAAGALATGLLSRACFGDDAGKRAAVLHACVAFIGSDGDINYSFWMATPFTLAAACAVASLHVRDPRRHGLLWFGAGALALFAVSIKPSAWPLLALFAVAFGIELHARERSRVVRLVLAGIAGALATALLVSAPFLIANEVGVLLEGLASVSAFGNEYVGLVKNGAGGRLQAIVNGLPCMVEQLPGPLALALAGLVRLPGPQARFRFELLAYVFLALAFVGVTFTLRFYSHDNAQLVPALVLVAVRPGGLVAALLDRAGGRWFQQGFASLLLGLLAALPVVQSRIWYGRFMADRDRMIADICSDVRPLLRAEDPVLAWGWHGWSVYEHCERRAPGRVFKVLASVTTLNTNTCNRGYGRMSLRSGPDTEQFLRDFMKRPPGLFLWTSYFKEMGGDPLDEFHELKALLETHYTVSFVKGPFVALLRNDLSGREELSSSGTFERPAATVSESTCSHRSP